MRVVAIEATTLTTVYNEGRESVGPVSMILPDVPMSILTTTPRLTLTTPPALLALTRYLALRVHRQYTRAASCALQPLQGPIAVHDNGTVIVTYAAALAQQVLGPPPSLAECARQVRQLLTALTRAHEQGLVHGELRLSSLVLTREAQPALLGMGLPNLRVPTPIWTFPTMDDDLRDFALLVPRLLARHGAHSAPGAAEITHMLQRLQHGELVERYHAARELDRALQRLEAPLWPRFGFVVPPSVPERDGFRVEDLDLELQGPLKGVQWSASGESLNTFELYTPHLKLSLSSHRSRQGELYLARIEREQPTAEKQFRLKEIPLHYHAGEPSAELMDILNTGDTDVIRLAPDAFATWRPYLIGRFVYEQDRRQYDREHHFWATITRLDDGREPRQARLELSDVHPHDPTAVASAAWWHQFEDARSITLKGEGFRARGLHFHDGALVVEMQWDTIPDTARVELFDQGDDALLQRQKKALDTLYAGQAVNPRLPGILLDPAGARETLPVPVHQLYQALEPEAEMRSLIGRILAAPDLFALQGPPGTGKTTIITEVILHELARHPEARILVTSQSNEAVENVFERLRQLRDDSRIRLPKAFLTYRDGRQSLSSPDFIAWAEGVRDRSAAYGHHALTDWRQNVTHQDTEAEYLRATNIYGATLTRLPPLLRKLEAATTFDLVIVDEAARATLPELLMAVLQGRRVLLVGDHRQLPPRLERLRERDLLAKNFTAHEIRTSVFQALFEGQAGTAPLPASLRHTLNTQYRMHPSIARIVSDAFYDGQLRTGTLSDRGLPMPTLNSQPRALWWDLPGTERDLSRRPDERRWLNEVQLDGTGTLLLNLDAALAAHPPSSPLSIAVICAYREQAVRTRALVSGMLPDFRALRADDLKVDTVDGFQGQERDIIIYVYTRNAEATRWVTDPQRLNVAFSRARRLLIVIGDRMHNLQQSTLADFSQEFLDLPGRYKERRREA